MPSIKTSAEDSIFFATFFFFFPLMKGGEQIKERLVRLNCCYLLSCDLKSHIMLHPPLELRVTGTLAATPSRESGDHLVWNR